MRPPSHVAGVAPGIVRPSTSCQLNEPPLLATYSLPSGPIAEPLGPPPVSATGSTEPSGETRLMRPPWISTSTTLPSDIATGPSGNFSPLASSRTSAIGTPSARSTRSARELITSRPLVGPSQRIGEPARDAGVLALLPQRHDDELSARRVVAADVDHVAIGEIADEDRPALAALDAAGGPRLRDAPGDLGTRIEPPGDPLAEALDRVVGDGDEDGAAQHLAI